MSRKIRKKNKKLKIPISYRKEPLTGRPLKTIGRLPAMTVIIDGMPVEDYYNQEYNKLLLGPLSQGVNFFFSTEAADEG